MTSKESLHYASEEKCAATLETKLFEMQSDLEPTPEGDGTRKGKPAHQWFYRYLPNPVDLFFYASIGTHRIQFEHFAQGRCPFTLAGVHQGKIVE